MEVLPPEGIVSVVGRLFPLIQTNQVGYCHVPLRPEPERRSDVINGAFPLKGE
jgi:hypothetical protein